MTQNAAQAKPADDGSMPGLSWLRIAVTAAALALYWVGLKIPAPGLSASGIPSTMTQGSLGGALERLSIFALGLMPLLSVLILLEVLKLAAPKWMASFRPKGASQTEIGPRTLAFTLALAALQAYGVASALESVSTGSDALVSETGAAFRATYVVTAVAATAFLIWLADQITRHGIGSGVWLLLASATLGSLVELPALLGELFKTGQISSSIVIAFVALFVAVVALIVVLARAIGAAVPHARNGALAQTLLWPPIIAATAYGYVSGLAGLLQQATEVATVGPNYFQHGTASGMIVFVGLNFFLTRAMSPAPFGLALAAAAVTSAVTVLTESWSRLGLPALVDFWLIPLVLAILVALPVRLEDRFPDGPAADQDRHNGD